MSSNRSNADRPTALYTEKDKLNTDRPTALYTKKDKAK